MDLSPRVSEVRKVNLKQRTTGALRVAPDSSLTTEIRRSDLPASPPPTPSCLSSGRPRSTSPWPKQDRRHGLRDRCEVALLSHCCSATPSIRLPSGPVMSALASRGSSPDAERKLLGALGFLRRRLEHQSVRRAECGMQSCWSGKNCSADPSHFTSRFWARDQVCRLPAAFFGACAMSTYNSRLPLWP